MEQPLALKDELRNPVSFPELESRAGRIVPDNNRDVYHRSDTAFKKKIKSENLIRSFKIKKE